MAQKNVPNLTAASAGKPDHSVLKSAGVMGAATFLSRIMGLVREQVFAVFFGAGNLTDAFNIAFRIPNLLRDLFAEGALSSAFIPTFTRVKKERGERAAWRVAGLVFRSLFVMVSILALIGIALAPELVNLYAHSFKAVPGKFELTVLMTKVLFPFFPLVALAAAFMGILNACGKFFVPAFSSALFNIFSIISGLFFAWLLPQYGHPAIVGMAIGVVMGGAVQAFSQLPLLYRVGYRWYKKTPQDPAWHQEPALRQMLMLMLPSIVGLAATQVNVLINSVLATREGPGAVSWLSYSFRLMQFPIGIFGVSIAAATLPQVSRLFVDGNLDGVKRQLTQSLKNVFTINLPASAGLGFLGIPIVQLLFEYGKFTPTDTQSTSWALAAYAIGLTAYSAVKVLVPVCYALNRTRQAVISSVLSVGVTIGFNLMLVERLSFVGLALGTSIAAFFNAFYLMVVLRRHLEKFELLRAFFIHLAIALAMGGLGYMSWFWLRTTLPESLLPWGASSAVVAAFRLFKVFLLVIEGALVVVFLGWIFRVPETLEISQLFLKKIKNKVRGSKKSG
jgi:putative peptidoglycan lipid II flippase